MVLDALGFDGGPPRDELVKRLRSGQAWLIRHQVDLDGPDEVAERFLEVLDQWDGMDEEVRRLGFEGCPIGPRGCPDETPAKCRHCGNAERPTQNEGQGQTKLFPLGHMKH